MARFRPNTKDLMMTVPVTLNLYRDYGPHLDLSLDPVEAIALVTAIGEQNEMLKSYLLLSDAKKEGHELSGLEERNILLAQHTLQNVYERLVKRATQRGWLNASVNEAIEKGNKL